MKEYIKVMMDLVMKISSQDFIARHSKHIQDNIQGRFQHHLVDNMEQPIQATM